jgi:hypothetical protein
MIPPLNDTSLDDRVPEEMAEALTDASRRALESGHPVVFVQGGQLVRQDATGITVLKQRPGRQKAETRIKSSQS